MDGAVADIRFDRHGPGLGPALLIGGRRYLRDRGQQLLASVIASGVGVSSEQTLRTAESLAGRGEYDRALLLCRQTVLQAKAPEDVKFAADAMMIIGAIYASREWFHEAAVAFDAVARRWPKSEAAPDALWRAIQCFVEIEETDGLPMFKRLIDERSRQLVRDYPTDPHVGQLQLLEAYVARHRDRTRSQRSRRPHA